MSIRTLEDALTHIKRNWSDYSGQWRNILDPDVENEIKDIYKNVAQKPIYRMLRLDSFDEFNKDDLGIYWTYNKDKAKAYWGNGKYLVLLTARVSDNDIDWVGTIECQLKPSTAGEEEVRLKETAKPKIIRIEKSTISRRLLGALRKVLTK